MASPHEKLVIIASTGLDDERTSVTWSVANGGIASGLDVTVFLVASGADIVRKGAIAHARMNPLDPPVKDMVENFMESGGKVIVCPPCAKVRGYEPEDMIDGIEVAGSPAVHALIKEGAATLCF